MSCTATESIHVGDVDTFSINWTAWLAGKSAELGTTVTIASASWSVDEGALTVRDASVFDSQRQTRTWVDASDMKYNQQAVLTCTVTTTAGHVRSESVIFAATRRCP